MELSRRSSQFIAYVLTWANGLLLVPGLSFACFGVMMTLLIDGLGTPIDPVAEARRRQMNAAIIAGIVLAGCVLLWGYWRHARGKAVPGGSLLLWLLTIVYNAAPIFRFVCAPSLSPLSPLAVLMLLWPITTIILALVAIGFDLRQRADSHPDAERS